MSKKRADKRFSVGSKYPEQKFLMLSARHSISQARKTSRKVHDRFIKLRPEMEVRKLFEQLVFLALIWKPCIAANTDISACFQIYALILLCLVLSIVGNACAGLHIYNNIGFTVYIVMNKMICRCWRYSRDNASEKETFIPVFLYIAVRTI